MKRNAIIILIVFAAFLIADSFNGGGGSSSSSAGVPTWLKITNPLTPTFAWRNQGGATVVSNTSQQSIYLTAPVGAGDNIRGREIAAPAAPMSITIAIIPQIHNQNFNSAGLYVTDGTKIELTGILATENAVGASLIVEKYTNATTFGSTVFSAGQGSFISPIFLKVVDDGVNLTWSWSPDGVGFIQLYQEARTSYLASIADVGFFANSNNATYPAASLLISWTQGTS